MGIVDDPDIPRCGDWVKCPCIKPVVHRGSHQCRHGTEWGKWIAYHPESQTMPDLHADCRAQLEAAQQAAVTSTLAHGETAKQLDEANAGKQEAEAYAAALVVEATRLLTVAEVAEGLAVSYWTVRRWALDGKVQYVRLPGGTLRIPPEEMERLKARTPELAISGVG